MEDRPCVLRMRLEFPELDRRDQLGAQRDQEHGLEERRFIDNLQKMLYCWPILP